MILIFLLWILAFFVCFIIGFTIVNLTRHQYGKHKNANYSGFGLIEYFLMGFLSLSVVTGIFSIFIPVGMSLFNIVLSIAVVLLFLQLNNFKEQYFIFKKKFAEIDNWVWLIIGFLLVLFLMASVQKISLWDTQLYHSQAIKWVRNYAVVPGLGNIHGRFAFNSMFFVVSGLFTFELGNVVIYPINSLLFALLIIKLVLLFFQSGRNNELSKAVFYFLIIVGLIYPLIHYINSPSPDIICTLLTTYAIISLINLQNIEKITNPFIFLISLLIISCMVYKLSYVFALLFLIPLFYKSKPIKSLLIVIISGLIIGIPFLIRNYYLSGYLIFPYPAIDIFTVDWKVPLQQVIIEKSWIESWARIPGKSYQEVLGLPFLAWFGQWIKSMNGFDLLLLIGNLFLVFPLIKMIRQKQYIISLIILSILVNLVFWFLNAPDPRFVYGLLLIGCAFTLSFFTGIIIQKQIQFEKISRYSFIAVILILFFRFIVFPINIAKNPKWTIIPAPMEKPEIQLYEKGFQYSVSLSGERCFNEDIPCVPYPLNNIVLRGNHLSDGFKVVQNQQ